jgi:hypothetical protein
MRSLPPRCKGHAKFAKTPGTARGSPGRNIP